MVQRTHSRGERTRSPKLPTVRAGPAHRRDLFSGLQLVFFDTTSISFEGEGGQEIGQRGYSKDHRPELYQMVIGAVLDAQGHPICCELWPGNTADVSTLIPLVDRLRSRFGIGTVCIVADRGMISRETIQALEAEQRNWQSILVARMRSQNEVKDEVLSRAGRYRVVHPKRLKSDDPSPLKLKEVRVGDRRSIVSGRRRGGLAVQAALDGGALVPLVQVIAPDPPDLPQV